MTSNQPTKKGKLGELMVESGIVSSIDIDHALQAQQVFGGSLGTNLVELGVIDDEVLAIFLSQQTGIERVSKKEWENVSQETLQLIPSKAAQQLSLIPLTLNGQSLLVAMMDPTDRRIIHRIEENIGYILYPKIAPELTIHMALKKYYDLALSPRISRLIHHQNMQKKEGNSPFKKFLEQNMPSGKAVEFFFRKITTLDAVPIVNPVQDIKEYPMTPELIFIFQQIDGVSSLADMIQMSVFSKLDTLRSLMYFYQKKLIRLQQIEMDDDDDEE